MGRTPRWAGKQDFERVCGRRPRAASTRCSEAAKIRLGRPLSPTPPHAPPPDALTVSHHRLSVPLPLCLAASLIASPSVRSYRRILHHLKVASVADIMTLVSQAIKDAVFEAIRKPSFDASLPPLSDATWAKLLGSQAKLERERLEFVGDALMYATIGTVLYKQIPDGNPHMYTVRSRQVSGLKA